MTAKAHLILLTNPIDQAAHDALSQVAQVCTTSVDDKNWSELAAEASIIIVRSPIPASLPAQAKKLLGIIRYGAGVDMIPVSEATSLGIAVANAPSANANSVAEYAIGQMLNLARKLTETDQLLRSKGWLAARQSAPSSFDLQGKRVAIVGMGGIGRRLAHKCQVGFDMQVIAVRRSAPSTPDPYINASLDEALAIADIVVLACPLSAETINLINAQRLALMKPTAWLINVSRGPIVNEEALINALQNGNIGGAALDVFAEQPMSDNSPFLSLPNTLLSPHIAGITHESLSRIGVLVTEQALALLAGRLPKHLVNREAEAAIQARVTSLLASSSHL